MLRLRDAGEADSRSCTTSWRTIDGYLYPFKDLTCRNHLAAKAAEKLTLRALMRHWKDATVQPRTTDSRPRDKQRAKSSQIPGLYQKKNSLPCGELWGHTLEHRQDIEEFHKWQDISLSFQGGCYFKKLRRLFCPSFKSIPPWSVRRSLLWRLQRAESPSSWAKCQRHTTWRRGRTWKADASWSHLHEPNPREANQVQKNKELQSRFTIKLRSTIKAKVRIISAFGDWN